MTLPPLNVQDILSWADAHWKRTGTWPKIDSGPIIEAPGETWAKVHQALHKGFRELPGGSSLAKLLAEQRKSRTNHHCPPLTEQQILTWGDAFHKRTGRWPSQNSGVIQDAVDETWGAVNSALANGLRGLAGGSSLPQLFAERRGARNRANLPKLKEDEVLAWADAFHRDTGKWPKQKSGSIAEVPGETWLAVNHALRRGTRGLPGGSSLARLIKEHRATHSLD